MSIHVETLIRAPMGPLWERTQDPVLHERWDLRFTRIEYLPRASDAAVQRFRYTTRIGLGLAITGEGETVGERHLRDGARSSALRFGSASPLSLIREGSGYWKYTPGPDGIRFITSYDYRTRHGRLGQLADRLILRPLMGWATAWSFDRLRLWLEEDVSPALAMRSAIVHAIARLTLAFTFAYHGLVPKIIGRHPDENVMLTDAGLPVGAVDATLVVVGLAEVMVAIGLLLLWHRRWPAAAVAAFGIVALVVVTMTSPGYLGAAFNPLTLNIGLVALATIDWLVLPMVPTASRCRRRPRRSSR